MAQSSSKTKDFGALTEQFCSVTGASKEIALHLLEACNGDLEMAVCMHIDGTANGETPSGNPNQGDTLGDMAASDCLPDEIRAPIPQKREQLVEVQQHGFGHGGRRRAATSVFDGFRDFQAEIRQAEERARQGLAVSSRKKQTLEDLFRPPIDLMYKGSFHGAKETGTRTNKWLMINIQNVQEFACQVLNRDVWSNAAVKEIVKYNFVFWQVYSDSDDGKRYMQFYQVKKWPCIDVIDPITGEHMVQWNTTDPATLIELINMFIAEHPKPDGSTSSPPAKRSKRESSLIEASEESQLEAAIQASLKETQVTLTSKASDSNNSDYELEAFSDSASDNEDNHKPDLSQSSKRALVSSDSDSEGVLSSNSELGRKPIGKGKASVSSRAMIKNGHLKKVNVILTSDEESDLDDGDLSPGNSDKCCDNGVETVSQESQSSTKSWKDFLGQDSDAKTQLLIRFPDGRRDTLTLPCTSQLRAITEYVSESDIDLTTHELVTNFPRRNFSDMDLSTTLQDIGLHAQETIFIHKKS